MINNLATKKKAKKYKYDKSKWSVQWFSCSLPTDQYNRLQLTPLKARLLANKLFEEYLKSNNV